MDEKGHKDRGKTSSQIECRCEESKRKSLLEILKTILKDLIFWKNKEKSNRYML